jgi:lysophospholipase L1-like esterase
VATIPHHAFVNRPANWVFLGDSLTEGIGSSRATFVTELANRLRAAGARAVHDIRLREVDPDQFNPDIRVNLAGYLRTDERQTGSALWLWNLGSEGRTIDTDIQWLPFLQNLRPERVFVHRGSLESILRPACWRDGAWPAWVPKSWRGLVSMDPRCYFSDAWHRRLKQSTIDDLKQRARHRLLRQRPPKPFYEIDTIATHYATLLESLRGLTTAVTVLGLLPPSHDTFPGSAAHFAAVNVRLRALAAECGADFLDWGSQFDQRAEPLFYRDGFHPNAAGASRLAAILHDRLVQQRVA